MKDPFMVLREKERDVERVRKEVRSLLMVIPLLSEELPSTSIVHEMILDSVGTAADADAGMLQLKRYYPFIQHL